MVSTCGEIDFSASLMVVWTARRLSFGGRDFHRADLTRRRRGGVGSREDGLSYPSWEHQWKTRLIDVDLNLPCFSRT